MTVWANDVRNATMETFTKCVYSTGVHISTFVIRTKETKKNKSFLSTCLYSTITAVFCPGLIYINIVLVNTGILCCNTVDMWADTNVSEKHNCLHLQG